MTNDPGSTGNDTTEEPVRTGVGGVDDVIRSVEQLEERPVEEHVGVFEAAHTQLRYALDHPEESQAGDELADEHPAGDQPAGA